MAALWDPSRQPWASETAGTLGGFKYAVFYTVQLSKRYLFHMRMGVPWHWWIIGTEVPCESPELLPITWTSKLSTEPYPGRQSITASCDRLPIFSVIKCEKRTIKCRVPMGTPRSLDSRLRSGMMPRGAPVDSPVAGSDWRVRDSASSQW